MGLTLRFPPLAIKNISIYKIQNKKIKLNNQEHYINN